MGIYGMSASKETFSDQNANIAADLFISRYGNECSLYMMALYFAGYIMDYKGTFSPFDIQDILLQFRAKFLPWWNSRLDAIQYAESNSDNGEPAGTEALIIWLNNAIKNGENVRNGGLYKLGMLTEDMIQKAEAEYKPALF